MPAIVFFIKNKFSWKPCNIICVNNYLFGTTVEWSIPKIWNAIFRILQRNPGREKIIDVCDSMNTCNMGA